MAIETPVSRSYTLNGLAINTLEWGDPNRRDILVLLHHVESTSHTWYEVAPVLANRFRVVAMDLRGHADSGWAGEGNYKTEDYASDVIALIETLGVWPVDLLGGSIGGRVALVTAAQRPDLVKHLIMEDVGVERPPHIAQRLQARAREEPVFKSMDEVIEHFRNRYAHAPEEAVRAVAPHAVKRDPAGRLVWKRDPALAKDFVEVALWDYLEKVQCPTLFIVGAENNIVPPEMAERMLKTAKNARLVKVEGAGHYVALAKPDEFLRAVTGFLAE